jgi:hypothetical protein
MRMKEIITFKSRFGGIVPYLQRQALIASGKSSGPIELPRSPPVSKTGLERVPVSTYLGKSFTFEPEYMDYYGRMEGYNFVTSIPKFDPWVRDLLREEDPLLEESFTNKYLRDPSTPDRVMKHFCRYDRQWQKMPKTSRMRKAMRIVDEMFGCLKHSIDPIDFNYQGWCEIVNHLEMTSSPGLPLRREYTTQAECLPYIYDKAKRLNHFAKFLPAHKVRAPPCMIGLRPGMTDFEQLEEKVKARGVWAYPAEVKVVEQRFVVPIMEKLSQHFGDIPYVTGVNMTKCLPMIIDHLLVRGKKAMVSDIHHLDDSVGPDYINWAFDLIESWLDMGSTKSSIKRNENVMNFIRYYFINTLILLPSGQLVRKHGGVPSGSGFTQLVDTLVTLVITVYSLLEQGADESEIRNFIFCVGDDVATTVKVDFSLEQFSRSLNRLGYEMNPSKAFLTDDGSDLVFLGYGKYGGHVRRSFEDLLKNALFPERYVGSEARSTSRLLGQLVAGGMCDPKFNHLVHKAFEKRLFRPLSEDDQYIPQTKWFRKVFGEDTEFPTHLNAFDLYLLI